MKNFVAGVLVTSSLLLVGFQGKKPTPRYSYQWQKAGLRLGWQSQLNAGAAKGGRLVHVTFDGGGDDNVGGGYPQYFFWEFEIK